MQVNFNVLHFIQSKNLAFTFKVFITDMHMQTMYQKLQHFTWNVLYTLEKFQSMIF